MYELHFSARLQVNFCVYMKSEYMTGGYGNFNYGPDFLSFSQALYPHNTSSKHIIIPQHPLFAGTVLEKENQGFLSFSTSDRDWFGCYPCNMSHTPAL